MKYSKVLSILLLVLLVLILTVAWLKSRAEEEKQKLAQTMRANPTASQPPTSLPAPAEYPGRTKKGKIILDPGAKTREIELNSRISELATQLEEQKKIISELKKKLASDLSLRDSETFEVAPEPTPPAKAASARASLPPLKPALGIPGTASMASAPSPPPPPPAISSPPAEYRPPYQLTPEDKRRLKEQEESQEKENIALREAIQKNTLKLKQETEKYDRLMEEFQQEVKKKQK